MTRRLKAPLADWTADDVLALIEEGIDEGQRLEYKRELNLDDQKQSREAAKDSSGMGNAQGGLVIYGVEEKELEDGRRVPVAPYPLNDGAVQSRLEDVLDAAVTPTLNLETRLLETDGGYFLVVRVHQRTGVPHMVTSYKEKRHYIRSGMKTRPMEQHELEAAYRAAATSEDRALRRLSGLPLVPQLEGIDNARNIQATVDGPWISVVTLAVDAPDPLLEMRSVDATDFRDNGDFERWGRESPLWGGYTWDDLGYVREFDAGNGVISQRMRLYRNGVFEWGDETGLEKPEVASVSIAEKVHDTLGYFATAYRDAGYYGRLRIWVSIDNAQDSTLAVSQRFIRFGKSKLKAARVEWRSDDNVERLLHNLAAVTHAAMDRVWVAYGFDRCWYFDQDGTFKPDG